MASQDAIAAVRRFNRFYTRQIGVLRKTYLDSPYSLGEMRVLYELAHGDQLTASDIGRALDLDAGYLSRLLRNFEKRGLISRTTSAKDARQSHLALTARGRKLFAPMEQRSQQQAGAMLDKLDDCATGPDRRGHDTRSRRCSPARRQRNPTQSPDTFCAIRDPAISAGSFPAMPSSMRRNTAGTSRSKACARRSSPISSTTSIPSASAAGSRR